MNFMARGCINGMMEENMKAIGIRIKCMDMEYSVGRMEGFMRVNIIWIRRKGMVFSIGRMGGSIEVIGRMESNMEGGFILIKKKFRK